jgi:hypothetical protein
MSGASGGGIAPRLGRICHVQAPGGYLQLAKIIDNRFGPDGHIWTLVRWIDVRRDAEWVPAFIIPPQDMKACHDPAT